MKSWICAVCGYVHQGDAPPKECVLCGANSSEFKLEEEKATNPVVTDRWECTLCGYIHEGPNPPQECPLCGADASQFKPAPAPATLAESGPVTVTADHIVIIGAGIAGVAAAEAARKTSAAVRITLISAEDHLPYYRINLTRYLAGDIARADLEMHPAAWYADHQIALRTRAAVSSIDATKRVLTLASGESIAYEKLVLTAGAHPFVPPVPGADLPGVISVRTLDDADQLLAMATAGKRLLVVGGGLLGLETAGAMARRGANVSLMESHGYLMPQQLDATGGEVLGRHLASLGVTLLSGVHLNTIAADGRALCALLEEGSKIAADVIVLATGVRSTTHLARTAHLEVKKGVVVNSRMETSAGDIYAAGDVCEHLGMCYGNWAVAQMQGKVAGENSAGGHAEFCGVPRSHTLKVLGVDTVSIGQFNPPDGSYRRISQQQGGTYHSFVFRDGVMVGANLVGDDSVAAPVRAAIETRRSFAQLLMRAPSAGDVIAELQVAAPLLT